MKLKAIVVPKLMSHIIKEGDEFEVLPKKNMCRIGDFIANKGKKLWHINIGFDAVLLKQVRNKKKKSVKLQVN